MSLSLEEKHKEEASNRKTDFIDVYCTKFESNCSFTAKQFEFFQLDSMDHKKQEKQNIVL